MFEFIIFSSFIAGDWRKALRRIQVAGAESGGRRRDHSQQGGSWQSFQDGRQADHRSIGRTLYWRGKVKPNLHLSKLIFL